VIQSHNRLGCTAYQLHTFLHLAGDEGSARPQTAVPSALRKGQTQQVVPVAAREVSMHTNHAGELDNDTHSTGSNSEYCGERVLCPLVRVIEIVRHAGCSNWVKG
jgi:hypothetical protein